MGIEAREMQTPQIANRVVVTEINPGMILQDLAQGLDKNMIAQKYAYQDAGGNVESIELWMVEEMFKDPLLKGKRPAKVKILPFRFQASTPDAGIKDVTFNPLSSVTETTVSTTVEAGTEVDTTSYVEETVTETVDSVVEVTTEEEFDNDPFA